jgi:hypothetical protein
MQHEVLAVSKQVLGAEDPDTLAAAVRLALGAQGMVAEAEEMLREMLAMIFTETSE